MGIFKAIFDNVNEAETYKIIATKSGDQLVVSVCPTGDNGLAPFTVSATPEELDSELHTTIADILETNTSIKDAAARHKAELEAKAAEKKSKAKKSSSSKSAPAKVEKKPDEPWKVELSKIKGSVKDGDETSMRAAIRKLKASSFYKDHNEFNALAEDIKRKVLSLTPSLM